MESTKVYRLIDRYLAAVKLLSGRLQEEYEVVSLIVGRQSGPIPREGRFEKEGSFSFHGVGCRIDDGQSSGDFDFGPGGRIDGFDAWRLHVFASDHLADIGGWRDFAVDESDWASNTLGLGAHESTGLSGRSAARVR